MMNTLTNMKLKKSIKRILREETEIPIRARRRITIIDELLPFKVKNYYKPDFLCKYTSDEEFIEVLTYSVIETMYWDYFGDMDDNLKEWNIIFEYMEKYIKDNYGERLKTYYHTNCGD